MHFITIASQLLAATGSGSKTSTSSGGSPVFLVLIVIIALLYFFVMRPNQKRRMAAMRQARTFDIGDEVVAGGMVGRVVRMDESTVDIEVSDGVTVRFVPQAVQLRSAYLAAQARTYGGRNAARARGASSTPVPGSAPANGASSSSGPVLDVDAPSGAYGGYGSNTVQPEIPSAVDGAQPPNAPGVAPASGER